MWTVRDFRQAFKDEVGEVQTLVRDAAVDRWANEAQARLRYYRQRDTAINWAAGASSVAVPTDFHHEEKIEPDPGVCVPSHYYWGTTIRFRYPEGVTGGTGRLFYHANWPEINGQNPSLLPSLGDQACLSFCLYRFFKRLASSRADFRKYAAIAQSNGVGVDDLATLAEQHYSDFTESRDALLDTIPEPSLYFE